MSKVVIGLLTLDLYLPGVSSLKEKRGILKSMQAKIQRQFNIATAEVDHHDIWQSAQIAITTVSNSSRHIQQTLQTVTVWVETHFPEIVIIQNKIEIIR
ncbi:MAG: hypothetical protein Kow00117_23520 [Phototrophicales bacterium]|nr:MAG: DUF503 domain-containing protein [Chloroflexota bacterium]